MSIKYKIVNTIEGVPCSVIKTDIDNINYGIPFDPTNTDYQEYLQFLADGGVPEPADE